MEDTMFDYFARKSSANLGMILAAFSLGAAVVALGGRSGKRRRALVRDKIVHGLHEAADVADATARDVKNRARGTAHEVKSALSRSAYAPVTDEVVQARARARLGRVCSHPHAVHIVAREGVLELTGPILNDEHDAVLSALRHVHGVRDVVDKLEVHADASHIPSLQGEGRRGEPIHQEWTPTTRLLAGSFGALLVGWALATRRLFSFMGGAAGGLLLGRAVTNVEVRRLVGIGPRRHGVEVQKTLRVHAPIEEVFNRFAALESFPRFMTHVKEVRRIEDDRGQMRFHWRVEGPLGIPAEWDAVVTRLEPGRLIAWKSIEGSSVENAGFLRFEEENDGATRMTLQLSYNPPAGAVGHAFAKLFGHDAKSLLDDDLLRFQSLVEVGKATGKEGQVTSTQLGGEGPATVH
jgi:uncharacterized membrane protein